MGRMALRPKQQKFVDEYLIDLNATQAAIRAGYSKRTARFIGSENLTKPDIAAAIAAAQAKRSAKVELTAEFVLQGLRDNLAIAMSKKLWNGSVANRALELLGKHIGLFPDRHEFTGRNGGPLQVSVVEDQGWYGNDAHEKSAARTAAPSKNGNHRFAESAPPSGNGSH